MEYVVFAVSIVILILAAMIFVTLKKQNPTADSRGFEDLKRELEQLRDDIHKQKQDNDAALSQLRQELNSNVQTAVQNSGTSVQRSILSLGDNLQKQQQGSADSQSKLLRQMISIADTKAAASSKDISDNLLHTEKTLNDRLADMNERIDSMKKNINAQLMQHEERLGSFEKNTENKLEQMRRAISENSDKLTGDNNACLEAIRATLEQKLDKLNSDNNARLSEIRGTVDEKLQETLEKKMTESFKRVSDELEKVYKSIGEMQEVANGVGDIKKVLSNVKTRGILGEIQLGAILRDILAPEQYEENAAVVPGSANRVEFAVKLPGAEEDKVVYLPIDSKFNGDRYAQLQDAYDSGDRSRITAAKKELEIALRQCAKDIHDKYISPPSTTQFAIMFLPFEGLYAEVVNSGLVAVLQHDYNVNIAGPSTMAAVLNSLQMGFRTLAIQKRSSEVWSVLGAVKTEFDTFSDALAKAQKHLRAADADIENLIGVRTRQMQKKLSSVDRLSE